MEMSSVSHEITPEHVLAFLDFIEQTTVFIENAQLTALQYGRQPLPAVRNEIDLSIATANEYLGAIGGLDHFFTQEGTDVPCTLIGWNGYDVVAGTHEWAVSIEGHNGAVDIGGELINELRAKHSIDM
jgi:hypothetical protein